MSQSDFYSEPTGPGDEPQSSGEQSQERPNGSAEERSAPVNGQSAGGENRGQQQRFGRQGGGGGRRRRGRGRRGRGPNGHAQRGDRHRGGGQRRAFTGPMDHSYRNQNGGENMGNLAHPSGQQRGGRQRFRRGGRGGGFQPNFPQQMGSRGFSQSASDLEPLSVAADAPT